MTSVLRNYAALAVAVTALVYATSASAAGTLSGITVNNRASVDYQVGGVDQVPIESAPGGNSSPGVGNGEDTAFVVDNRIDLTVAEVSGAATTTSPGQANAVAAFTVTNTGNTAQDYALSIVNLSGGSVFSNTDTIDLNNLRARVDSDGNGIYDSGTDTANFIDELAADGTVTVFAVVDVPIDATDGDAGNVTLTATTHDSGAAGLGTLTAETAGADDPAVVDIVFGDAGGDGLQADDGSFLVQAASLLVSKASAVINDPFNGTTNPLAIPGALMEYTITITNSGATDAASVRITDVINGNLTFETGQYDGNASDVEITVGTQPTTFCTADANDADADGCALTGGTLEIQPGITVGTDATTNPAVIRFRVSIN
jgi:uncharacterized repeat protein (TIGR01451 family)